MSRWVTPRIAKNAAKRGVWAALDCSVEHWRQISEATPEELFQHRPHLDTEDCALCCWAEDQHPRPKDDFLGCTRCPLAEHEPKCTWTNSAYHAAHGAWNDVRNHLAERGFETTVYWERWQRAATHMHRVLVMCRDRYCEEHPEPEDLTIHYRRVRPRRK
jgi:hypothetical protein